MANVLPAGAQKKIWAMYRARLSLVTGLFLLGFAAAFALALFPGFAALRSIARDDDASQARAESSRTDALALERSQFLVEALDLTISATSSLDVALSVLALRPEDVRVSRVMYSKGAEESTVTIIGTGTREQVSAYRDALAQAALFSSVSVPASALVGTGSSNFSIVLSGAF